MIALVTDRPEHDATVQAFREETPDHLVLPSDWPVEAIDAARGARQVIPTSPAAVSGAARLAGALGLAQDRLPGPSDQRKVMANREVVDGGSADPTHMAQFVARDEAVVCAGIYAHRSGRQVVSLSSADPLFGLLEDYACRCVARLRRGDGATTVEIVLADGAPDLWEVIPAPTSFTATADAAFAACGASHQHLLTESILRPREFARRAMRSPWSGPYTLGLARLGEGTASGPVPGLRVIRRLTGFHSVSADATVAFVHPDRASVENSLTILRELEESGSLFGPDRPLISFAGRSC